jgi:hypothetical protein
MTTRKVVRAEAALGGSMARHRTSSAAGRKHLSTYLTIFPVGKILK